MESGLGGGSSDASRWQAQKALLEKSFIQMESAQSAIQGQLAALNNAFGSSSSK